MRVTTPAPTTVARTTETKAPTAAKPTVATTVGSKVSADVKNLGHSIVDGGCFPPHPLPPFPFPQLSPDRQSRATQGEQLHEVADGVRNGSITAKESEELLKEQKAIADAQKAAMADGKLSIGERVKLAVMQARAEAHIEQASGNKDRNFLAHFDSDAQRQAGQIDRIANGRTSGNVTNTEASELLGQQVEVADARGDADSAAENFALDRKLDNADKEISRHSAPGTQFDLKPFPHPLPLPLPRPFPLPRPLPLPELPRPLPQPLPRNPPVFEALSFTKGTTNV